MNKVIHHAAQLMRSGNSGDLESARLLLDMQVRLEDLEPRCHAYEHELKWLIALLDEEPVHLSVPGNDTRRVWAGQDRPFDRDLSSYVAKACPRLQALMQGEIPSLKEFQS